jgi:hypothetical protein
MLYKFKSRATADLIMLEPHGRRLLQIVGKAGDDRRGILRPDEVPRAIAAIEGALAEDDARRRAAEDEARASGRDPAPADSVSLRQRATPFIEMLRRSAQAGHDVVWGV